MHWLSSEDKVDPLEYCSRIIGFQNFVIQNNIQTSLPQKNRSTTETYWARYW